VAAVLVGILSLVLRALVRSIRRFRWVAAVLAWGGLVATTVSMLAETELSPVVYRLFRFEVARDGEAAMLGPAVEEWSRPWGFWRSC
jgi:hypothetical protein